MIQNILHMCTRSLKLDGRKILASSQPNLVKQLLLFRVGVGDLSRKPVLGTKQKEAELQICLESCLLCEGSQPVGKENTANEHGGAKLRSSVHPTLKKPVELPPALPLSYFIYLLLICLFLFHSSP